MATRSANTQQEALQSMLGQIAAMKATPDADMPFLINLETFVLQKLKEPYENQRRAMEQAQMGMAGMNPRMGAQGPLGTGAGAFPSPGQSRGFNGNSLPPVDELRRLLTAPQGT